MIDLSQVRCSSALHDASGVVFQHDGRFMRALSARGAAILEHIHSHYDLDNLGKLGLLVPRLTAHSIPGFTGVVEVPTLKPFVPPSLWTFETVFQSLQVLCSLNQELLKHGLVIWDLGTRDCMALTARRGPLVVDFGAIHTLDELQGRKLGTCLESLVSQISEAFLFPLWIGARYRNWHWVRALVDSLREDGREGIAAGLTRRLTLGGRLMPGWHKIKRLAKTNRLSEMYEYIATLAAAWERDWREMTARQGRPFIDRRQELAEDVADVVAAGLTKAPMTIGFLGDASLVSAGQSSVEDYDVYCCSEAWRWPSPALSAATTTYPAHGITALMCDAWRRDLRHVNQLYRAFDLVVCGGCVLDLSVSKRVPMDFIGLVLSKLTNQDALVTVHERSPSSAQEVIAPGFTQPLPNEAAIPVVRSTLGKHFSWSRILESRRPGETRILFGHDS